MESDESMEVAKSEDLLSTGERMDHDAVSLQLQLADTYLCCLGLYVSCC
jgi:hypothetical protein